MESYYVDHTSGDLRTLEAGNLYFSIAIKAKACAIFDDSVCAFEIINGNEDLKRLQDFFGKNSSYNPKQTGVEFLKSLDESYKNLTRPHNSTTILIEQAVKKYEVVKKYYFNELNDVEQIIFLQNNIGDHLDNEISGCIEKEKVLEKTI